MREDSARQKDLHGVLDGRVCMEGKVAPKKNAWE
jgi:hypothetical protein